LEMDADSYGDNAVECVEIAKKLMSEIKSETRG